MIAALLCLSAQASTHDVQATFGVSQVVRQDQLVSQRPYRGLLPSIDIGWTATRKRTAHRLALSVAAGNVTSGPLYDFTLQGETLTVWASSNVLADLRFGYGAQLPAGKWTLTVGGASANRLESMSFDAAFTGAYHYMGALSLAPWINLSLEDAGRHRLDVEAWSPVVHWFARSPYGINDAEYIWRLRDHNDLALQLRHLGAGRLASVETLRSGHARLTYGFGLSDHWRLVGQARVDAISMSDPRPSMEWQLGLNAGMQGRF